MIESKVVVVVDADPAGLRKTMSVLEGAGFVVVAVDSFSRAKAVLASISPEIVIADVRLGAFNGLHLAALNASRRPGTPFIVTHNVHDVVLEGEAARLGATYVLKTETRDDLTRATLRLLESHRRSGSAVVRRSHRKPAPLPTVAKVAASEAHLVDVSYGGVQLKWGSPRAPIEQEPPTVFDITLPQLDISLHASRVWAVPDAHVCGWRCGADVSGNESGELSRWRAFVDSIN